MNILEAFEASNCKEIIRYESGMRIIKRASKGVLQIHRNDLFAEDWEPVSEPKPVFKEVTRYAPVLKINEDIITSCLYSSIDACMVRMGAIGYTEVKVFLKTTEGEE